MITRSIGRILRGRATPVQLSLACVLGAMLGFAPGFWQGPALVVALLLAGIVLNCNLVLAGLVLALAKLASLILMPVSFGVGRWLLDGPPGGLFARAVNTPVLALMGLEYYVVSGGLVIGLVVGAAAAAVVVIGVRRFRLLMAGMEESSERYRRLAGKRWARALGWVLLGRGHGKATYKELASRRWGNPVRPAGVVCAGLAAGLLLLVWAFASEPIVTAALHRSLERANGATVDLRRADLDLRRGRLTAEGLAMADPEALATDLLRASRLEADISAADLLRKRLAFDNVVAADASSGEKRAVPGRLVGREARPRPPRPAPDEKTLEDYLRDAEVWRERLKQAREWLEKVEGPPEDPRERDETLRERLEREVREKGYARVAASHLVEGAPTLLVRRLAVEGLRSGRLEGELLDVRAENLSTQPWLVAERARVVVTSRAGTLGAEVAMPAVAERSGIVSFEYRGLDVDWFAGRMKFAGQTPPIRGGTIDVSAEGTWSPGAIIDLPLAVTLHGTTVSLPGAGSQKLERLGLAIGVRGPLDNPSIRFDQNAFADALAKAGAHELAARARGEAAKAIDKAVEDAAGKIGEGLPGKAKDALDLLRPPK